MSGAVTVFVCRKCRGARRTTELLEAETDARVRPVGCQKICADHVVGVRRDGELVCSNMPPNGDCSNPQEICTTAADCCDATNLCINGFCTVQPPQ